jgi:hypothetical protein
MGLRFDYPDQFMAIWQAHPVGVKKLGYDAWKKLKLTADENAELVEYLVNRHRDDAKWLQGTYVPHLSTFLNSRRWEDEYERARKPRETTSTVTADLWLRMGYASEADYYAGRRMNH